VGTAEYVALEVLNGLKAHPKVIIWEVCNTQSTSVADGRICMRLVGFV
jgi:hypothetical protein